MTAHDSQRPMRFPRIPIPPTSTQSKRGVFGYPSSRFLLRLALVPVIVLISESFRA